MRSGWLVLALMASSCVCGAIDDEYARLLAGLEDGGEADAGTADSGVDGGSGLDAGHDAGVQTGMDAGVDAGNSTDAGGVDAGPFGCLDGFGQPCLNCCQGLCCDNSTMGICGTCKP